MCFQKIASEPGLLFFQNRGPSPPPGPSAGGPPHRALGRAAPPRGPSAGAPPGAPRRDETEAAKRKREREEAEAEKARIAKARQYNSRIGP